MTPTPQQAAFIKALVTTTSNIALVARAGTGKTTTILQGVAAFHEKFPNAEVVVCAFNKAIADEVKDKLKKAGYPWQKVQGSTIHGLGFGLLRSFNAKVDANKVRDMIRARNEVIFQQYGAQINDLVRYAKGAGFGFFDAIGDNAAWYALADHYDVNGLDNTSEMDAVVSAAQDIYRASLAKTDVVDFDDMILFPLVMNIAVKYPKDLIILDEAQDLSKARQALARKFLKPRTGRMIIVGDDRQAIYGFSGADAEALNNLTQELDAVTLPLTVTWRCPKSVIREAQKIVADIECATDNEGEVNRVEELPADLLATDAILCRNTAPLVTIAYSLIRKGIACKVEGRAIGEGLLRLVNRWKVNSVDQFIRKLEDYRQREIQKAMAKNNEAKVEEVNDRVETLLQVCQAVTAKNLHSLTAVREFINNLFSDDVKGVLTLATYHRSKGREWTRVFLWEHSTRCPSRAAKQAWQQLQEQNLAYVAITRAKQTLTFVN